MGFRSPGHGLLAGYQSGMAHNLQRRQLDVSEQSLAAKQRNDEASNAAALAKAMDDRQKQLMADAKVVTDYLRDDTPDSRGLSIAYAREAEQYWGADWPEELRSSRLMPQAPVASPATAGAAPRPQQAGAPGLFSSWRAQGLGGTGRQAPGAAPEPVPTPSALLTPLARRGYGNAKLAADDAKAGRDIATYDLAGEMGNDLITWIATGGGQHEPRQGLFNAALNNPQALAPLLISHAANYTREGVDPAVAGAEMGRIWNMAMDLDRIDTGSTSRQYEAMRLRLQQDDQLRGYLSDVEKAVVTRFGGRITDAGIDMTTLTEGDRPRAIFFLQNALSKVLAGQHSAEAILRTTEEMGQIDFTPKSMKDAAADMGDFSPRPMIKTVNSPAVQPGTNLEPAEAAEFPWQQMFPGADYQFDPANGLYMLYIPTPDGNWQVSALDPKDVAEYVRLMRSSGINPTLGPTQQGLQWSIDARRAGEQKLMGRIGGR